MQNYSDQKERSTRHTARWRIVIVTDAGREAFGRTADIAVGGAAVYLEVYLQPQTEGTLMLEIPARPDVVARQVIQTQCRVVYSVHDAKVGRFRSGLQFMQMSDEDRKALQNAFAAYFSHSMALARENDS